jgi:DNA-nicking Smr family endonuclease
LAEDAALFRAAIGKVEPLPEQNRLPPAKKPFVYRTADPPDALPDTLFDSIDMHTPRDYLSNGLSRMSLRKLRRTKVEDSLDLHGSNTDTARMLLQQFLHEASQQSLRCVLVIHGKGKNSQGGEAVLQRLTRHWLMQRPDVLAFCDAPEGGSGAALVLLKSSEQEG